MSLRDRPVSFCTMFAGFSNGGADGVPWVPTFSTAPWTHSTVERSTP